MRFEGSQEAEGLEVTGNDVGRLLRVRNAAALQVLPRLVDRLAEVLAGTFRLADYDSGPKQVNVAPLA